MAEPPGPSRLRETGLSPTDRHVAVWLHVSPLLAFPALGPLAGVVPLIIWLTRRDVSAFNDDHGREVVNLSITGALLIALGFLTAGIGFLLWFAWAVVAAVNLVRGAIAASNGEYFRFPMTIRFLS